MPDKIKIFTFLFIMLGPFKIVGPFAKMTVGADPVFVRKIAMRAILFSCLAILIAGFLGESLLQKYGIPLPILSLTGGIILFLVALQGILQQYTPASQNEIVPPLTSEMTIRPLAFPMIVTPYGIAAVIVFLELSPDLETKLIIGGMLLGIMILNLVVMLMANKLLYFKGAFLQIIGAVLGIVQAALGLQIISDALKQVWSS